MQQEDGVEGIGGRSPCALGLGQAEVVEGSADGDHDVALQRVIGSGNTVRVALAKSSISRHSIVNDGSDVGLGLCLVGTDRHFKNVEMNTLVFIAIAHGHVLILCC